MTLLFHLSDFARSPGDPTVMRTGPSARPLADDMARALGWFSLALGAVELAAPHSLTRLLGMEGKETLIRAYGAREIAAGVTSLSTERSVGLWSRAAGDLIDIATLISAYRDDNPKKANVRIALAAVAAITLLDIGSATGSSRAHDRRGEGEARDYGDRSGFPGGAEDAKGKAAKAAA